MKLFILTTLVFALVSMPPQPFVGILRFTSQGTTHQGELVKPHAVFISSSGGPRSTPEALCVRVCRKPLFA